MLLKGKLKQKTGVFMFKPFKKPISSFLFSFAICLLSCFTAAVPLFVKDNNQTTAVEVPFTSAPYNDITTTVILGLKDAPVDFIIEISTTFGLKITCFPKLAIKNSNEQLPKGATEYEKVTFLGKSADRKILANTNLCVRLTNTLGGITCETPYGLPAPSGNKNLLALDETLHFYGSSVAEMLLSENEPDYEKMCFYAKLIGLITGKFLTAADTENYFLLNSLSDTDISYKDYYDNCATLKASVKDITATAVNGVWINNKYYIH